MIGELIAQRYLVAARLGEGGSGAVYEAADVKFKARVALKITSSQGTTSRARFRREAVIGNRLGRSAGFVRAFDWGEVGDGIRLFLAMDLVPGAQALDLRAGPLDERVARLEAAARIVAEAHGKGVIHRDLKPTNFLQATDGSLLLADFGLAKVLGADEEDDPTVDLTATNMAMGTPPFMPPEQFEDLRGVDERADVFALGVMLHLLLTGRYPFPGRSLEIYARQQRILREEVAVPRLDDDPAVPAYLADLCQRAIDLRRDHRLGSVEAFLEGLAGERSGSLRLSTELFASGLELQQAGSRAEAIATYSQALDAAPNFALAYYQRGVARTGEDDLPGALRDLDEAIRLSPRFADAFLARGAAHEARGSLDAALADYSRAVDLQPYAPEAYRSRGFARMLAEDHDGALSDYDRVLHLCPDDVSVLCHRGALRGLLGDVAGEIADYTRALEVDPGHASAYGKRSAARRRANDLAGAIADATRAIELQPDHAGAYFRRARAYRRTGQRELEIADYTQALALNGEYFEAWLRRGGALRKMGDLAAAYEDLSRAIELRPDDAEPYYLRGLVHCESGNYAQAADDLGEAIRREPGHALAYNSRGHARRKLGEIERAIEDFTRAIELAPENPRPYNNRGFARQRAGDLTGALADFDQAVVRAPTFAEAHRNRGLLLRRLGQEAAARESLRLATLARGARDVSSQDDEQSVSD